VSLVYFLLLKFVTQKQIIMRSIHVDILSDKVINILKELEKLKLIRLHTGISVPPNANIKLKKMKGTMSKETLDVLDNQLNELRKEWE
jgi:hypothetical protein